MITGETILIAHLGYPTETFKAPMIYNPYFEKRGRRRGDADGSQGRGLPEVPDAAVPPHQYPRRAGDHAAQGHDRRACSTRSHDREVAGACNAILRRPDGTLLGDMFDGAGFVRGVARKGGAIKGARALVVGSGGVGSAIAASLAAAGSPASACSTPTRLRPRRWARGCRRTTRSCRSRRAPRIRPAATSSSTRRRSA